jgi:hypothetical protein
MIPVKQITSLKAGTQLINGCFSIQTSGGLLVNEATIVILSQPARDDPGNTSPKGWCWPSNIQWNDGMAKIRFRRDEKRE